MTLEEAIIIIGNLTDSDNEYNVIDVQEAKTMAIEALEQESKVGHWKNFVLWVANEIFDEMWEYNADAFAEIACRKLAKLGIVREKDGEWELVESQESEG